MIGRRKESYDELVKKHQGEVDRLQRMIQNLREMAMQNPKWEGDIRATVDRLEEGWSIVERDPSEEEIKKELEYWHTVLTEDEGI